MKRILITYLLVLFGHIVYAQPQINNWFFSENALNFSSGIPVNIPGSKVFWEEGACSISDKNGQLLFYTDGISVWNKNHNKMPNGLGLAGGDGSSTQSSLIVPKTNDGLEYYIFTVDQTGNSTGLAYSIVDMSLDSGRGDVTIKNIGLVPLTCEKVTAVRHCNKKDYWVITHKYNSDAYYAYLVSESGVNPAPVISHTGIFIPIDIYTAVGALKSSPDGKKLVANHGYVGVELANFDNQTGVVSNAVEIFQNDNAVHYGVEFSSNSALVYVSIGAYWDAVDFKRYAGVFQFDISLPTTTLIRNSKVQLARNPSIDQPGLLQRGLDGKIYMAQYEKAYLSVIHAPNVYGTGCNYVNTGFILPTKAKFSLPNFINNYDSKDSFSINTSGLCINTPIGFNFVVTGNTTSILWDFGDPPSGSQNSSTIANPTHTYLSSGNYTITLIAYSPCGNDTITKQITIGGGLTVNLGADSSFCDNNSVILDPHSSGSNTYLWQDGSTSATYKASLPGIYWVQVTSSTNGCVMRDSTQLTTKPSPLISLGKDTTLCVGKNILLDAGNPGAQYLWQNNTTQQTFLVNQNGTYWVQVSSLNGCMKRDTIIISKSLKPQFSLGPDQYLCPGLSLQLSPGISGDSYLWQDGSTSLVYLARSNGLYYVDVRNTCGITRDSINIFTGSCTLYIPTAFTPNKDGLNDQFRVGGTGAVTEFELLIFDRFGHTIFSTKDKSAGWDGQYKGTYMPNGVYIYLIKYKAINDSNSKILKGTFVLLR